MKKLTALCLLLALVLACAACGATAQSPSVPASADASAQLSEEAPAPAEETAAPGEIPAQNEEEPEEAPAQAEAEEASVQNAPEESPAEQAPANTVLVVCFSATGNTRGVAEKIADLTGADLAEIIPAEPYTEEDLDYSDQTTRASAEQDDPDARPEIAEDISLEGYTTVYLGYPIWWGEAPRILSTFVESHDFSGITVIPFCTSGSSDIGQSDDALAGQAGTGNWLQGRRFPADVSEDELSEWIRETAGS